MGLKEKKKEEKKSMLGTGHNELSLIMPFPSILRHQTLGLPRRLGNFWFRRVPAGPLYINSSSNAAISGSPPAGGDQSTCAASNPASRRLSANPRTPRLTNTGFS